MTVIQVQLYKVRKALYLLVVYVHGSGSGCILVRIIQDVYLNHAKVISSLCVTIIWFLWRQSMPSTIHDHMTDEYRQLILLAIDQTSLIAASCLDREK